MKKNIVFLSISMLFTHIALHPTPSFQDRVAPILKGVREILVNTGAETTTEAIEKTQGLSVLLSMLEAETAQEAVENYSTLISADKSELDETDFDNIINRIARLVLSSYKSTANALGSKVIYNRAQEIADNNPEQVLTPKEAREFSQLIYDAIFELKKRYYESIEKNDWAQKYIKIVLQMHQMQQAGSSAEEIVQLLPKRLLPAPTLERIPRAQLIERLKQLEIEPPR